MKIILFICCLLIAPVVWAMDQEHIEPEQEMQHVVNDATEPCPLASEIAKGSCCVCRDRDYLERTMGADDSCHKYVCITCLEHSAACKPNEGGYEGSAWIWMSTDKFSCQTCGSEVSIRNRHNYRNF